VIKHVIRLIVCVVWLTPYASAQPMQIGIEQFERWIFQNSNAQQARVVLEQKIEMEITRIEQATVLEESQKERIRLAGKGDIKRFYDRVDTVCKQFQELEKNLNRNNINEVFQLTQPLQQELNRGLFGRTSLFHKVVASAVNNEQSETMKTEAKRRQRLKMENVAKIFVAQLGRQMPMTAKQRNEVLSIALANLGSFDADERSSLYLVPYRLSELPKETFESIFDETQLKAFNKTLEQGKAMKGFLKQQGLLDDE